MVTAMEPFSIEGAWLYTPVIHRDDRGSFLEMFRSADVSALAGRPQVAQVNCSVSQRGVVRGVHFADVPPGQAKYVSCTSGVILDVVVDLRVGSPTFGRWEAVTLDDDARQSVYISEGLGHAFMALSEVATVVYLCSTAYAPAREHGVHPFDPALAISWPEVAAPVLSGQDALAPSLEEALRGGMLPRHADCITMADATD